MSVFIDAHRDPYGVEPICRVLQVAPSSYYRIKAQASNPDLCSDRSKSDDQAMIQIRRVWDESGQRYGVRKVWEQLKLDLVRRNFKADRPNQLWVSDFTYVSTWAGFVYVAFVVDAYARRIVGWKVSYSMRTDFVLDALEQALHARKPSHEDGLIHHSDHGVQYLSIRYQEKKTLPILRQIIDTRTTVR